MSPRARNKKAKRRRKLRLGTVIWRAFWIIIALILGVLIGTYATTKVPSPEAVKLPQPTAVYFSDGTTKIGDLTAPTRTIVKLAEVAQPMQDAVLARQDPLFYKRPVLSFSDVLSGIWESAWGGQAASEQSLTYTYMDAVSTRSQLPVLDSLRRVFMPVKIDRTLSKDQILENYLNAAYFGRGAYGIEAGAQAYFGVSAKELSLAQAALLAAVIPAPSSWDPAVDAEQAKLQFAKVKEAMVAAGGISQEEADAAEFPAVNPPIRSESYSGVEGYILEYVRAELVSRGRIAPRVLDLGELSVVTTLDAQAQAAAIDAVAGVADSRPEAVQTGLISLDPASGEVKAMYGGADYSQRATNNAVAARVQAGTVFKVFGLVENFEQHLGVNNAYYHHPSGRVDREYYPSIPDLNHKITLLQDSVKYDLNDTFIRLGGDVGPATLKERATAMGVAADAAGLDDAKDNILGRAQVTPQEMARAFGAVANDGGLTTPYAVKEVKDGSGRVVYSGASEELKVMDPDSAKLTTFMMQYQFESPGVAAANGAAFASERPAAGLASNKVDTNGSWFVGYTPQLVTAVAMFQVDDAGSVVPIQPYGAVATMEGGGYPLKVWAAYMTAASQDLPVASFPDVTQLVQENTRDLTGIYPDGVEVVDPDRYVIKW